MKNQPQGLEGCSRCPICYEAPQEKVYESDITGELLIELVDDRHPFFIAMGNTLEGATQNYNRIVRFFEAGGFAKAA